MTEMLEKKLQQIIKNRKKYVTFSIEKSSDILYYIIYKGGFYDEKPKHKSNDCLVIVYLHDNSL